MLRFLSPAPPNNHVHDGPRITENQGTMHNGPGSALRHTAHSSLPEEGRRE